VTEEHDFACRVIYGMSADELAERRAEGSDLERVIRKAGSELVSVALVSDVIVAKPNPIGSRRTDREHEDVEYPG